MKRPVFILVALSLVVAALAGATGSGATFTSGSLNPVNVLRSGDWQAPAVSLTDPGSPLSGSVTLAATATDNLSGVDAVAIQRAPTGTTGWVDVCRDTTAPYSCALDTTTIADGAYDLRAVAVDVDGNSGPSAVVARRVIDNNAPSVTLESPADAVRATVTLSAIAEDGGTGVASVRIQRSPAGAARWTDVCTAGATPYACAWDTTKVADGAYDLRAIATDGLGRTATHQLAGELDADNTAPTVTANDPGSPLAGVVSLGATAADTTAGVARVTLQYSPAGQARWVDVCTDGTEPFACRLDTTAGATPDGLYEVRAIAVDAAGNERISAVVANRRIDNSVSTVSLEDPGAFLVGTVALAANANSSAGVRDVVIEYSKAGAGVWAAVCTDASAPFGCSFDTATAATPDGLYDLRAVMTNAAGAKLTSAVLAGRRIDNAPVRGFDVQAANLAGGAVGRLEAGDSVMLTWTKQMNPSTLIPGWSGAAAASLFVRVRDGALVGTGSAVDAIALTGDAAGAQALGIGAVSLGTDFVKSGKTVTFPATAVLESATVNGAAATRIRVTLGMPSAAAGLITSKAAATLTWTPSATATDLAGTKASTAPVTEAGAADRDF